MHRPPTRSLWLVCLASASLLAAPAAHADDPLRQELTARYQGPEVAEKLKDGGYVILMRHMATIHEPDQWSGVDLEDCSTQRVLSETGKQQARDLGAAFRTLGIPVGSVRASPYCRTRETAELAFGAPPTIDPVLSTWDHLPVDQKTRKATELRRILDTAPAAGTNTVLVTHTGNLLWSLGLDSRPEGLAHVFQPTGLPILRPTYIGRLDPHEWRALAGLPPAGNVAAPGAGEARAAGESAPAAE